MAMLLRLAYDGTEFHGFARQAGIRTVQGELEAALARIYKREIVTRGASRTDAGVHAQGQIVAFDPPFEIPTRGLLLGLAAGLPADMIASAAWLVDDPDGEPLNPRFHNLGKHYRYRIRTTALRDPMSARFEWHLPSLAGRAPLALDRMREAAPKLIGEHDFAAFRAVDCQAKHTVRRVRSIDLHVRTLAEIDPLASDIGRIDGAQAVASLEIDVRGEAFLKNMVRIIVGTFVGLGSGASMASASTSYCETAIGLGPDRPLRRRG